MMQLFRTSNIFLLSSLLALVACNDDTELTQDTLTGNGEKTPLAVTVLLDANSKTSQTRAAGMDFESGDQMVAYIRHVTWDGPVQSGNPNARLVVEADQAPKLVTFKCTGSKAWDNIINDILPFRADTILTITGTGSNPDTKQADGLTTSEGANLYWDDFSESTTDGKKDLRTADHYLQSYYGYCYNGGTPAIALGADDNHKEADGKIDWAVQSDQKTYGIKTSDLLWSAEQTPVSYAHCDANVDNSRPGLIIPYTHAMSKVTIKVTAGVGFDSDYDFKTGSNDTKVELKDMRLKCTANAPEAKLTYPDPVSTGDKDDVMMKPGTGTGTRSFEAIVVPSILTVGNTFAVITDMSGNTYNIPVTEEMVKYDASAETSKKGWGNQLEDAKEDVNNGMAQAPATRASNEIHVGTGYQMRSGVHYVLNVTVNKTSVQVSATILDWEEVEAEGVGEIRFSNDVTDTGNIAEALREDGFHVFKSIIKEDFGSIATTLHWNKTTLKWKYDPVIYWEGGAPEYFRALSNVEPAADGTITMKNDVDALWGTTSAHTGTDADGVAYEYKEGDPLKPRTGDVPLTFYHAMSKITVYLVDTLKDNSDPLARINLEKATIQLTDLATSGKLNLATGVIAPAAITSGQKTFSEDVNAVPARMGYYAAKENGVDTNYDPALTVNGYTVIPQDINDARIVITLADGTRYSALLKECTMKDTTTPIKKWERGQHYIYEIELGKETITFRALVENWTRVDGGGKATLEWD